MSSNSVKDRASLCSFTFADGCRTPLHSGHPHLCYSHARVDRFAVTKSKEAQVRAADEMGRDISSFLSGSYLSACDLSSAMGRLFTAVAQGQVKPRTASTLAYLGQTIVQSIHLAQHEYINAFGTTHWRETVRSSFTPASEQAPKQDSTPDTESIPHR